VFSCGNNNAIDRCVYAPSANYSATSMVLPAGLRYGILLVVNLSCLLRAALSVFRLAVETLCTDQGDILHGGADIRSAQSRSVTPWYVQMRAFMVQKLS